MTEETLRAFVLTALSLNEHCHQCPKCKVRWACEKNDCSVAELCCDCDPPTDEQVKEVKRRRSPYVQAQALADAIEAEGEKR